MFGDLVSWAVGSKVLSLTTEWRERQNELLLLTNIYITIIQHETSFCDRSMTTATLLDW